MFIINFFSIYSCLLKNFHFMVDFFFSRPLSKGTTSARIYLRLIDAQNYSRKLSVRFYKVEFCLWKAASTLLTSGGSASSNFCINVNFCTSEMFRDREIYLWKPNQGWYMTYNELHTTEHNTRFKLLSAYVVLVNVI